MFISVIIPTFNRKEVLKRAVLSVLKQEYKNFELIIVDDGSEDSTHAMIDELSTEYDREKKIRYINQDNRGVSAARNNGVQVSKYDWIAFLDSDDEWMGHKLSAQVEFLQNNPSFNFVHTEEIWVRNGKRVNPMKKHSKRNENLFERSFELCLISPSSVLIKKDLYERYEGFDESFIVCEDFDLWLKILNDQNVGFIKEPCLIKYGGHSDQLSKKFFAMDFYRVKSLGHLFFNLSNKSKRSKLKSIIEKKCHVLLNGYKKHNNMENYEEVIQILNTVLKS